MRKLLTLKKELLSQDISTLKISQDLRISPSLFSMYTNGWRPMPDEVKESVASYLNVEVSKLFNDFV